jgi:hypothetical protein
MARLRRAGFFARAFSGLEQSWERVKGVKNINIFLLQMNQPLHVKWMEMATRLVKKKL